MPASIEHFEPPKREARPAAGPEYLDWDAMKLLPHSVVFARVVQACMRSFETAGVTINFADRIPTVARECGLWLQLFRPIARIGRPGSLVWTWLTGFFQNCLPKLVAQGLLEPTEGDGLCYAPTMADAVLRKPN